MPTFNADGGRIMVVERVDYIIRVSFSSTAEGSFEEQAAQTMTRLMAELAAGADEVEIVHRRVFEVPGPARPPSRWIPLPCVRCKRFGTISFLRYCAACWGITGDRQVDIR